MRALSNFIKLLIYLDLAIGKQAYKFMSTRGSRQFCSHSARDFLDFIFHEEFVLLVKCHFMLSNDLIDYKPTLVQTKIWHRTHDTLSSEPNMAHYRVVSGVVCEFKLSAPIVTALMWKISYDIGSCCNNRRLILPSKSLQLCGYVMTAHSHVM